MPDQRSPRISVVVPVKNRKALLRDMLDSLAAQTFVEYEVIVVDDGSTDGMPAEVEADQRAGRPVRLVPNEGVGAYAGRRTGVAASTAPYLAFTDSDCVADPGWLAAGVAALDKGADLANGQTHAVRTPGPLERTMSSGEELLYPTCNVFYRRSAYDMAGGFDAGAADRFGFSAGSTQRAMGFGEDTLLAWRVRRQGGRAAFVPDAIVRHQVFPPDLADSLRRTWMMVAFPALFREVPELRGGPLVRHGVVLNTPDRLPVYATALALATGRRRLALASAAWWLGTRTNELRGRPGSVPVRLAALPVQLGIDVVTTVALAIGSVRHRTILLWTAPTVSVVVATHDRIELLPRVVRALEHEPNAADLELVVVDDASSDGTWEMLETLAENSALAMKPVRMPHNVGPAVARNTGWRAASAELIAFTDDDCIPQPGWVAAIVEALGRADLVQGVTLPDPGQADKRGPFSRWMEMRTEEGFYPTCNMGYRRQVLEAIGGFDEGFRHPYGEDTDLAWRAKEVGFSSALAPDAVVFHEMWPSDYLAYARDARRREGMVLAMSRHPGLRRRLGKGVFLWRRHPPAIAQLGALAFLIADPRSARRWTATLAAGAWYAWACRREHPKPRRRAAWAAVVPLSLAADAYEIGVLAAASVRYRTLLL